LAEHPMFNSSLDEAAGEIVVKHEKNVGIAVAALQGGTFTITNIGPIGGLYANPIVNHPEVAILGLMKLQKRPMVRDGGIHVRDMMNLCLSFDHRVVDGADAAQFMNTIIRGLENPRTLL
ncbi:MAG: 2-oxo acid dehydrogenase subunit E2, partial [Elusimicrobia bacterium]|nr:2-oxo acid dehydrogenase subunit E2 [Elusimicrobiota bacterium]